MRLDQALAEPPSVAPHASCGGPFDVAVIGAGVVGCAVARRFTLEGARVVVLEKALDILDGASKGNSGLLHTGFDAPVGSLEHACIVEGYREYRSLTDELGLALMETGALVLAWNSSEAQRLDELMDTAQRNGVGVQPLSAKEIRAREPQVAEHVVAGFRVPGEHVIDPWTAPHLYLLQALLNGAALLRGTEVLSGTLGDEGSNGWLLKTSAGSLHAKLVINCAGLHGDTVDRRLLGAAHFKIRPRKGQFVVFDKRAASLVRSILLPVPSETTKGIVVCPTIYGNVLVGPTAEDQESRCDASVDHPTLERLRTRAVTMVPALAGVDITATYAGLRPATEEKDYRIVPFAEEQYISVGGIRSTGLSGALGIAAHVWRLYAEGRGRQHTAPVAPVRPRLNPIAETKPRDYASAGNGGIVCHCELVSRREVLAALEGPLAVKTLAGLKRRTRATMGRCQGFYCSAALAELTAGRLAVPLAEPLTNGHVNHHPDPSQTTAAREPA